MFNSMYSNYNAQANIDRINNQIMELEKLKQQIPQQIPQGITQNFQLAPGFSGLKYANSYDEVQKDITLIDTPYFSHDMSILWLKTANGEIKIYELNEIVQKDVYKIKRMKEDENMYGEYGRYEGRRYDAYGRDNYGDNYSRGSYGESYGKRGYDAKYRGHEYIDRIGENYGRYMYGRERYGNSEDTKRSLKYMLESMEDFAHKLREDAQSQEEVQMIRETAQRIASM